MLDWSVIIVNWNVRDKLRECLRSVFASENAGTIEVFVVDNGSKDGSCQMIAAEFPRAKLIANKTNKGFATACNQAIKKSLGSKILLLNPDCFLDASALGALGLFIAGHPKAGIVGGKLTGEDGGPQMSVRRFPTPASQAAILVKLHHFYPGLRQVKHYLARDHDYGKSSSVDQIMGAFFAIPRQVIAEVGMLDERFFLWFEEVDFCKRVKNAGYEIYYTPLASATHIGGASFSQMPAAAKQKIWNKSLNAYMRKHHGLSASLVLKPLYPLSRGLAWFYDKFSRHEQM